MFISLVNQTLFRLVYYYPPFLLHTRRNEAKQGLVDETTCSSCTQLVWPARPSPASALPARRGGIRVNVTLVCDTNFIYYTSTVYSVFQVVNGYSCQRAGADSGGQKLYKSTFVIYLSAVLTNKLS